MLHSGDLIVEMQVRQNNTNYSYKNKLESREYTVETVWKKYANYTPKLLLLYDPCRLFKKK